MLLQNEQFGIIQFFYNALRASSSSRGTFSHVSALTSNIHPYHRDFLETFGNTGKDVSLAADRWAWITAPDGMWEHWVAIPQSERDYLVDVPMDSSMIGNYNPTGTHDFLDEFLPVGGP